MTVRYDPIKGQVIDDQAVLGQTQAPLGLDPIARKRWEEEHQVEQANQAAEQAAAAGANKPLFAANPLDELGNIIGNAGTGFVTDFLDIGAGLADTAVQAGNVAQGKSWDWNNFFNRSAPIYTHPRYLPASKINRCSIDHVVIGDGCIVTDSSLKHCVIGIRSILGENSHLEDRSEEHTSELQSH